MYVFKITFLCSLICLLLAAGKDVMELPGDDFSTRIAEHDQYLSCFMPHGVCIVKS